MSDPLLQEALAITSAAEQSGVSVALLGGLAVRAWIGPSSRVTFDIDLIVADAAMVERLGAILRERDYRLRDDPWWHRAAKGVAPDRVLVDWTGPEVVNPRTLKRFQVSPFGFHAP